jgi:glutathione synthase/RimK-type ligase-like ATP-grasp enzyme
VNLLIISHHQDNHAAIVALAAAELGHSVTLWAGPATSAATTATVRIDKATQTWCLGGKQYDSSHFDTVWYRRRLPVALPEGIHPADVRFADTEVQEFYDDLWTIATPGTRWIHSPQATLTGEWKMRQLSIAKSLGLNIPPTLVSNERAAILDFISRVEGEGGQVVYKTFSPMSWGENGRSRTMYTAPVTLEQIQSNPFIEAVPGIYQKRIPKAYEIRANFFGSDELSARIESTSLTYGEEDWRAELDLQDVLSPMSLPDAIREKCSGMLRSMSFDMACFDFIVDPQGDHYFLELNHQGQFLWVEDECPEIPMLDTFVRFATGDDAVAGSPLALARFMDSEAHRRISAEFSKTRHVELQGKRTST